MNNNTTVSGVFDSYSFLTTEEIIALFNERVPKTIYEPYLKGRPGCKHSWRPWKFNTDFEQCGHCWAQRRVKKLVPMEYR